MKGKLQFDLRRNLGAAGLIKAAHKIPGFAVIAILALAAPAFAQVSFDAHDSGDVPADVASASPTFAAPTGPGDAGSDTFAPPAGAAIVAPDSGYALPPPDDGSLADPAASPGDAGTPDAATSAENPATGEASVADGSTAGDALPSSLPPIDLTSPLGGIAPVASADRDSGAASHSGWDRVGDSESDAGSDSDSGNPVLEVPRAVPSPDASLGNDANQSAQGGDSAPPDQVGSVDEYQNEQDYNPMAIYISPATGPPLLNPPFAASTFGNHSTANVSTQPGVGPMLPSGIGGVRPFAGGMNSAIMPTSPMFPRGMPMQSYRPTAPIYAMPMIRIE